jgi:hypothetical protein
VAEHSLPDGKRWIENLLDLGKALGYWAEPEFDVTPTEVEDAPVDVAWLASDDDRFPLFIFEVESRPSGQMVYNAAKVFGQDTLLFQKPLFHFHLVLRGGQTTGRMSAVSELFGKFNYRVYRVAEGGAADALKDIFSQHRRVRSTVDVPALARALTAARWQDVDIDGVWKHIEAARFNAPWARNYAQLALADKTFLTRLTRVLAADADGELTIDSRQYGSFTTEHTAPLLHAAILAQQRPERATQCFERVRSVQGDGHDRRFAPRYGLSQDYDALVFSIMPAVWALLAAALTDVDGARVWVLEQMDLVIAQESRIPFVLSALTAIWMLHVAANGGENALEFYERATAMLNDEGGVSPSMFARPPMQGGNLTDLDSWWEELTTDASAVPSVEEMRGRQAGAASTLTSVALKYLLEELPPDASPALLSALE